MNITCCIGCKNREIGCHSKCQKYQEERRKFDELKTLKRQASNSPVVQYTCESIRKKVKKGSKYKEFPNLRIRSK